MNNTISLPESNSSFEALTPEENEKKNAPGNTPNPRSILQITEDGYREIKFMDKNLKKKSREFEELSKRLNSFSYISSHDLQEPLRKIQTFSSRILEKEHQNLSEQGKEYFDRVQKAAKRMQVLIQDLSAYSKLDTAEKEFKKTDLNVIINQVQNDLKDVISEKKALIDCSSLCEANILPFQFRQLIYNLFSNALKFSHPEKQLYITVKSRIIKRNKLSAKKASVKKNYCHINISDNGIGFDPQYGKRIFEVFQRLHGKDEYEGTGIGLAICKKIIKNHGGIIKAKGELNNGASFDIYIPAD
jgi:light-regulated signal transduction histidine kinase (bacteriophytochrome)